MAVNSKSAKKQFAFPLKFYTEHQFGFSFTYFEISAETMKAYYRVSMHSRLTEPPAVNSMPKTCLMTFTAEGRIPAPTAGLQFYKLGLNLLTTY